MNCNEAFDRLTMPSGRSDARLSAHLAGCPRCRAMAETLEPALELFSRTADEPGPSDQTSPSAVAIAKKSAARLRRRDGQTQTVRRWPRGLGWAAAALAGAACCFVAVQMNDRSGAPGQAASCPRQSPVAIEWMSRNSLPMAMACVACHPPAGGPVPGLPSIKSGASLGGAALRTL
jgi:hypothetical protein